MPSSFSQLQGKPRFTSKLLWRQGFLQSGCSLSFPVVTCCGGFEPGQIRDKFIRPFRSVFGCDPAQPELPPFVQAVIPISSRRRRKQARNKDEGDSGKPQDDLRDRSLTEIEAIVADFHARLPRESARSIGATYARFSTRFQQSIGDQVRTLYEEAERERIFIPLENVFFDTAARGYSSRRPGLNELRAAFEDRKIDVLLVFATNRLFRKTYKSLQFVEEEVVERGIRCIFVKSKIDTADEKRWRLFLQISAAMDESVVSMYADHVRAAHEGLFLRGMVCTSLPMGYTGEVVAGEETKRKRPRRRIIIDENQARYVRKAFSWFADDGITIQSIAQRLNGDPEAPSPPKSPSGTWNHRSVRYLLANPCYRGEWAYGRKETKWQSKKDYAKQVERKKPLKVEFFEHLRIVTDETWYAAHARLLENESQAGRRSKDGDKTSRPRVLNGLFWCPTHNRRLYVGGGFGRNMFCKDCRASLAAARPLFSELNRELALKITCEKIAELIQADNDLVARVIHSCEEAMTAGQQVDPSELKRHRAEEQRLRRRIEFTVRNLGDTHQDDQLATDLVNDLDRQRSIVLAEITRLEAIRGTEVTVPTKLEIRAALEELGKTLTKAASGVADEDAPLVRHIIKMVTGGRIDLYQQGERRPKRGWLQGRFRVKLLRLVLDRCSGRHPAPEDDAIELTLDYRQPVPFVAEADRAWALYKEDKRLCDIADLLRCSRSKVTKLMKYAAEQRGETLEDGRKRRHRIPGKAETIPLYQRIADEVQRLLDEQFLMHEIATRLQCDINTVTKAVAFWHESRGLEIPDGRARRKSLKRKKSPKDQSDGD